MHEISLRGLIRVFGATFPCIHPEAKYLHRQPNGVFGAGCCSVAVSTTWSWAVQELTQQPGFREKPWGSPESRRGGKQGEGKALQTQHRTFWAVLHGQQPFVYKLITLRNMLVLCTM